MIRKETYMATFLGKLLGMLLCGYIAVSTEVITVAAKLQELALDFIVTVFSEA